MAAMVVDTGKAIAANRMLAAGTEPKYVGWGTSNTAEAAGQTDLQTAATEARTSGTSSRVTGSVTNDTYRVVATITCAGAGKTIQEVATFDAAGSGSPPSGGTMFLRAVHGAQTLNVGDSIEYTIDTRFG